MTKHLADSFENYCPNGTCRQLSPSAEAEDEAEWLNGFWEGSKNEGQERKGARDEN